MSTQALSTDLTGLVALVTGGGAGIGAACCHALAARGATVAVADLNTAAAASVAAEIGGRDYSADVTDPDAMLRLVAQVTADLGRLDIAVNNAGIAGVLAPTTECPLENWDRVVGTNLSGVFYSMRAEIPAIVAQGGGAVINIASILGMVAAAGTPAYTAAKHGVVGLTKVAALEYGAQNVRVNAVAPSYIRTALTLGALPQEAWGDLEVRHALGRCATPDEIGGLVAFLASPAARFISGAIYQVDGAFTAT